MVYCDDSTDNPDKDPDDDDPDDDREDNQDVTKTCLAVLGCVPHSAFYHNY